MTRNTLLLLSVIAALVGCGGETPVTPDGGTTPDASTTPDGGVQPDAPTAEAVCDDVRTIELALGANEITGNTAGRGNDLELGTNCGDPEGAVRAPQEAIALTIPGTGPVGVSFTLANEGTATEFDTIVELRREGCENLAGAELCQEWDDVAYPDDTRSGGAFRATGGDTVHLIVSGFATANAGPWQIDAEVNALTAPTQTAVTVERIGGTRFEFDVTGGDVDSDAAGILVAFLDGSGAEIGIDPDGDPATPDETEFQFGFDEPVTGMATFTAHSTVGGVDEFPQLLTAEQVRVAVVDAWGLESEPMTASITDLMESGRGEPCTTGYVCADDFECVADVCTIPAATVTFCAAATPVALVPAGTTATSATVTGSVPAMAGSIHDAEVCESDTTGAEVLYQLTVPAAVAPVTAYDVVLDTENATTGMGDTIVYLQSTCGDPETTGECNDDIDFEGENFASHLETNAVAAGTHTIVVEGYGVLMAALPFELEVSLRPVLATGTACDPAGAMNRCAAGACPAATPVCP